MILNSTISVILFRILSLQEHIHSEVLMPKFFEEFLQMIENLHQIVLKMLAPVFDFSWTRMTGLIVRLLQNSQYRQVLNLYLWKSGLR